MLDSDFVIHPSDVKVYLNKEEPISPEVPEPTIDVSEQTSPITENSDPFKQFLQTFAENVKKAKEMQAAIPEPSVSTEEIKEEQQSEPTNDPLLKFLTTLTEVVKNDEKIENFQHAKEITTEIVNKIKEETTEEVLAARKRKNTYIPKKFLKKTSKEKESEQTQRAEKSVEVQKDEVSIPVETKSNPVVETVEDAPISTQEPTEETKESNPYVQQLQSLDKNTKTSKKITQPGDIKSLIEKSVREQVNQFKEEIMMKVSHFGEGGGGTVAVQYAGGGTMDGTLNVNGQILSGGRDISNFFGSGGGGGATDRLTSGYEELVLNPDGSVTFPDNVIRPIEDNIITLESENTALSAFTRVAVSPYAFFAYDSNSNSITFDSVDNSIVLTSQDNYEWTFNDKGQLIGPNNILTVGGTLSTIGRILSGGKDLSDIFLTSATDSQTLTYEASSYKLSISNGNNVSLSSLANIPGDTSVNTLVHSNSSNWNDAYTNLVSNSAAYLSGYDLSFLGVSGNWNSTYTTVCSNSSNWDSAYNVATTYQNASGSFATNTLLQSTSALLTPLSLTNFLTGQLVTNSNFSNYQTNVAASTATLLPTSVYQNTSGSFIQTVNGTANQINASTVGSTITLSFPSSATFPGDVSIAGNLTIAGSSTYVNTQNLIVGDNIIYLNDNNYGSNVLDTGFVSHFTQAPLGYNHTGLVRRAGQGTPGVWTLFSGLTTEPASASNIDWTDKNLVVDSLSANLIGNVTGNADTVTNGVYTTGSYSDPSWITSIADTKIAGTKFATNTDVNSLTSQLVKTTDFNNYQTLVATSTATLLPTTVFQNTSGSFATNTLLQSTSALLTPLTTTNALTSQLVLNTAINSISGNWNTAYQALSTNPYILNQSLSTTNTIIGFNTANNTFSEVLGGACNTASGTYSTIVNGFSSCATGYATFVGAGSGIRATGNYASVVGGIRNTASGAYSLVGGGCLNSAGGISVGGSVVGGGICNQANANYATVGGGFRNCANVANAFIGGGNSNAACGSAAFVGAGTSNISCGGCSSAVGGQTNLASGSFSTVVGGFSGCATGYATFVGAGSGVCATGPYAVAVGGQNNTASGTYSTIAGGGANRATGCYAYIGGGVSITASGNCSVVGGGRVQTASGLTSTIAGGSSNNASGIGATIGGGSYNTNGNGQYGVIAGGYSHNVTSNFGSIGGGCVNTVSGTYSVVAGGVGNFNPLRDSIIGGGVANHTGGYAPFNITASASISGNGSQTCLIGTGIQNCFSYPFTSNNVSVYYATAANPLSAGAFCTATIAATGTNYVIINGDYSTCTASGLSATSIYVYDRAINNTGCANFIGGGKLNTASGNYGVVVGGKLNTASGCYHTIVGGSSNTINTSTASTYSNSFIGGGCANLICGNSGLGVIVGGCGNCIIGTGGGAPGTLPGFIGGGRNNIISCNAPTIVGGISNVSTGSCATFIGAGFNNQIICASHSATIAGGSQNVICNSSNSFIGGGVQNRIPAGANSTIGGGKFNYNPLFNSSIEGGSFNHTGGYAPANITFGANLSGNGACTALIATGIQNCFSPSNTTGAVTLVWMTSGTANSSLSSACFTTANVVTNAANCIVINGDYSACSTGLSACSVYVYDRCLNNNGCFNFIGGGVLNTASGNYSVVGGGICNRNTGVYNTLGGGIQNNALGSVSTVGGGRNNTTCSGYNTIAGGRNGIAAGQGSAVGGGVNNTASGYCATVAGGSFNCVGNSVYNNPNGSIIGGGQLNCTLGFMTFIGGGCTNNISGNIYSVIAGGQSNIISSNHSFVAGGSANDTKGFANTFILGTALSASAANYTYVNNLSVQGNIASNTAYTATAYLSATTTAPTNSDLWLPLSVKNDPNNWITNIGTYPALSGKITPTVPGYYFVNYQIAWNGTTGTGQNNAQIRLNGTNTKSLVQMPLFTGSGGAQSQTATAIVYMNGTSDSLNFSAYSSGTGQTVVGTTDGNWTKVEVYKIN